MAGEGPPSTPLFTQGKGVDADLRRHDDAAQPDSRCHGGLVLLQQRLAFPDLSLDQPKRLADRRTVG